jgi:hypothetical protein
MAISWLMDRGKQKVPDKHFRPEHFSFPVIPAQAGMTGLGHCFRRFAGFPLSRE